MAIQSVGARGEGYLRLVLQRCVFQCSVAFRHIRWVTGDEVEAAVLQGGEPRAFEKLDAVQAQRRRRLRARY